jgi:hypothetical protein
MFKRKNNFISKMLWQFKSNKMIKLNGMTHIKSNKVLKLNGMTHTKISISRVIKVMFGVDIKKICDIATHEQ